MRTTVTLSPDVAQKVKAEMQRTGLSFRDVLNCLLRRAFSVPETQDKPFKINARPMGLKPGLNFDNIGELLEQLEGPWHK
jgi:hypothetical protein